MSSSDGHWSLPAVDLSSGVVTVLVARRDRPPAPWEALAAHVAPAERAHATRLRVPEDAQRHLLGRALARRALAPLLGCAPPDIPLGLAAAGKPGLAAGTPAFNLSHAGDWVLCALAGTGRLGIDVEVPRPLADREAVVARILAPAERPAWDALPPGARDAAFLRTWTRKEAWLKALGVGIGHATDVQVHHAPGVADAAWDLTLAGERRAGWTVRPLAGLEGAEAAVAWDRPLERVAVVRV